MQDFKHFFYEKTLGEEKMSNIDKLQAALDVAGVEPTIGSFADGANAVISALRAGKAAVAGEKDEAKEHIINMGISAVSLIPFADVIKLLKLRKLGKKPVKAAVAAGKHLKQAGAGLKQARAATSASQLTGGSETDMRAAGQVYGQSVQKNNLPRQIK